MPTYCLIFTPEANADVEAAAKYYSDQLSGLGKIFKKEVKKQLDQIKQNPFTRSVRYDDVRFAVTSKFPYSIHYSVLNNAITVHGVISDHRDPSEHWKFK